MGHDTFRDRPHVLGLVSLVGRIIQEETGRRLQTLGLTYAQAVTLVRLWRSDDGRLPQSAMIRSLALSRASGTQMLNDLETRGLISRSADPTDGRRLVIGLTDLGREVERPALLVFDGMEEILTGSISQGDRRATEEVLRRMLDNLLDNEEEA